MHTGQCECGAVEFQVPQLRDTITVCHCSQCRRSSGHLWASTVAPAKTVKFTKDEGLTWYKSSDFAERGFCKHCGSSLFYRMQDDDRLAIAAGCLNSPEGLEITKHIFVKDKACYYQITDQAEQLQTY